jgi:hypothetical protein
LYVPRFSKNWIKEINSMGTKFLGSKTDKVAGKPQPGEDAKPRGIKWRKNATHGTPAK